MTPLDAVAKQADHERVILLAYYRGPVVVRWRRNGVRYAAEGRGLETAVRRAAAVVAKQAAR